MKIIGLIGGLTYVSSLEYYRLLNEIVNEKLGGSEAAEILMYSVNFGEIRKQTETGNWQEISKIICKAAAILEKSGAACILIGANTMHKIADDVQKTVSIPVIHIAREVAKEITKKNMKTVALLGTKYTMQFDFYRNTLSEFNIRTIIPGIDDIEIINDTIYKEFSKNIFLPETKKKYQEIIKKLQQEGAEGIILGCTEIPILLKQEDCEIPLFDTAKIHSQAAVDFALS